MSIPTGFRSLLPPCVMCSSTTVLTHDGPLSEDEKRYISSASPKRQMEFATGRRCAVEALGALGMRVPSLGRRDNRLPEWPAGTIGSITHCDGLVVAAVSQKADTRFLGIDAEPNKPLPPGLLQRIASGHEQTTINAVSSKASSVGCLDRTLFSAKECLFKALYPVVDRYFGFEEVEISFDVEAGTFTAVLSKDLRAAVHMTALHGRFVTSPEHTVTALHVDA